MKSKKIEHWKVIAVCLFIFDIFAVNFSYFFGLWIRFDFDFSLIPNSYMRVFYNFSPLYTMFCLVIFYLLNMYRCIWRFISIKELNKIIVSSVITTIFQIFGTTFLFGGTLLYHRMPMSYYVIGATTQAIILVASRFSYRYILTYVKRIKVSSNKINVMLIGGGAAGQTIIGEIAKSDNSNLKACCIIDDNTNKWGRYIDGIPVVGGRESILENVEKYKISQIFFVIPSATAEQKRDILNICKEANCELKQLPGLYQFMSGEVKLDKMQAVAVEDLLGREPIKVNMEEIFQYIEGKIILVTGGGGSIGSELCRQIAAHNPKQLIIFDIYENNAYDIEQELKRKYPYLNLKVLIGSVRDSGRINSIFEMYRPDIVYHAAAHKHVPLMEESPCESIKNNVIGTYKTAYAALKNGTKKFVLISTDKAVNPTNIMGASKRMCEMIIQSMNKVSQEGIDEILPLIYSHKENDELHDSEGKARVNEIIDGPDKEERYKTEFVAVRFGNVLGSNGSVIPLFKKQIESGGPVTVTHPDIIRYFMTIPEAVSLVLQAGTYAKGGEIFVLDMGEPVKIDTLARNLIKLSGFKPDEDIKIMYTGLRPGEKLYEEKLMAEEGMEKTPNKLIHIGKPIPLDIKQFFAELKVLAKYCYSESDYITEMVSIIVPTYHSENVNKKDVDRVKEELKQEINILLGK